VDDAIAAITTAANHSKIDPQKIFVLGHSLGGYACPLIAKIAGLEKLRGLVLLAANARNLADMMLEQVTYIHSLNTCVDEKALENLRTAVTNVHDPSLSESFPKDQLLNISPKYWLFLRKYDPIKTAQSIEQPMLVLTAGRDYQVTNSDLEMWKEVKDDVRVTYKEYPGLNHLMMPCDPSVRNKRATPSEYNNQGNVDEEVIIDITKWVNTVVLT